MHRARVQSIDPPAETNLDALLNDIRYALRRLRHTPAFTLIVVTTLALGIGANAAIFSVINTVLLTPLPYSDPGKLVTIYHFYPTQKLEASVSAPGFRDYRDHTHSFSSVAVTSGWAANLTGAGDPQRLAGTKVSGLFFQTLGVAPDIGRGVLESDDQEGHDRVVVLSHGLWQSQFGGQRDVVGKTVMLNSLPYQVIGVMPAGFVDPFAPATQLWSALAIPASRFAGGYTNEYLNLVARLKPGVALDQASREMAAFANQLKRDQPSQFSPDWTLEVRSLTAVQTGKIRPALLVLLGSVAFVLLIACANVANLLLVRAASRQREVAIRTALGAKRSHLVRQLLAESLILSLSGAVAGLAIAYGGLKLLAAGNLLRVPRSQDIAVDGRVAAFAVVLAVITGVAFGLVPALQLWRGNLQATLKESSRGGTADQQSQLVRRGLVVAEIALALALLAGGGLLLRSFSRLAHVNPGFNASHLVTFNLALPAAKYANDTARIALWNRLLPRIEQVSGVELAGATTNIPFGGNWSTASINVEGYTPPPNANGPWGDIRQVTPDYLRTMQIPLISGRQFSAHDDAKAPAVAIIDQEFQRRYFAGRNPIGGRIYFGSQTPDSTTQYITVVGVVGHAMHEGLDAEPRVQYYLPVAQSNGGGAAFLGIAVRVRGDPLLRVNAIRAAVHEVDRDLPLAAVNTEDALVSQSLGSRRLSTVLLGVFAALALLLASLGIYGVMSYAVTQRTRELGVRVALGASRENVLGLVVRQGLAITGLGAVIGLLAALGLTRLIASQLYATSATDPLTLGGVTLVLVAVAFAATLLPALRATRIDPIVALREE